MAGLIWNFAYKDKSAADSTFNQGPFTTYNPPYLVAPGNSEKGNRLNVANDFYWTYSKPGDVARKEVPTIILKEKRLKVNALVSQLIYSFGASVDSAQGIIRNIFGEETANEVNNMVNSALGNVAPTAQQARDIGGSIAGPEISARLSDITRRIAADVRDENNVYDQAPWLEPYRNLYITKDTGWEFILPYFENYQGFSSNSFSGDPANPFLGLLKGGV